MLKIGNDTISSVFLGNAAISAVYCGSDLIWPEEIPPTPPTPANALQVSGAGSTELNGTYYKQNFTYGDHDVYMKQDGVGFIFWDPYRDRWMIARIMDDFMLYEQCAYYNSTILGQWTGVNYDQEYGGTDPAPIVSNA